MEQDALSLFDIVVWSGAAVTLAGLAVLIWCILRVAKVRRSSSDDDAMRQTLQKIVPFNLGALFLSIVGLMLVVVGLILR